MSERPRGLRSVARTAMVLTGAVLSLVMVLAGASVAITRFGMTGVTGGLRVGLVSAATWGLLFVLVAGWDVRRTARETATFNAWAAAHPQGPGSCWPRCEHCRPAPVPPAAALPVPVPLVEVTINEAPAQRGWAA